MLKMSHITACMTLMLFCSDLKYVLVCVIEALKLPDQHILYEVSLDKAISSHYLPFIHILSERLLNKNVFSSFNK